MGTVVLVRHGETEWNDTERVQGWAPVELNERGRRQAEVLGRHLASNYDVDGIVASDLTRTVETTRFVRRALETDDVTFTSVWRERDFGVQQGLGYEELFTRHPEFSILLSGVEGARAQPEGGESWLDFGERILDAWTELLDSVEDETVVVITHGGPIHVVVGELRELDIVETIAEIDVDNCAVTEVDVSDGEATLKRDCAVDFFEE